MVRDYELMYIVRPELDDDAVRSAVQSVRTILESNEGEVVKTTLWGKRRLAYEVDRLREGHYVLVAVRLDGDRVAAVERALRIHDNVFRHLLTIHEGPMPEPDGELDEVPPEAAAELAPLETDEESGAENGGAASAQLEQTGVQDTELEAAPSAADEDDEGES